MPPKRKATEQPVNAGSGAANPDDDKFEKLPMSDDVLIELFNTLPGKDAVALSKTSKRHKTAYDDSVHGKKRRVRDSHYVVAVAFKAAMMKGEGSSVENALNALIALLKEPRSKHIFKNDGKGFWKDIKEAMTLEDGVFNDPNQTYTMGDLIANAKANPAKLNELAEAMTTNIDTALYIPRRVTVGDIAWHEADQTSLPNFFAKKIRPRVDAQEAIVSLRTTKEGTQHISLQSPWTTQPLLQWHERAYEVLTKENNKGWELSHFNEMPEYIGVFEAALWALITLSPMPNEEGIDATLRAAFVDRPLF